MDKEQFKRAKENINILNGCIQDDEELIAEINQTIRKAKDIYSVEVYQAINSLEENKRQLKADIRKMKESKKRLLFLIADYDEIDKNTKDTVSNIPLTREYLQANYRVCDTFKEVTLNSINDNLPVRLSDHALNKLINECFPEVESRRITGDIKYNLEMIL